MSNNAVAEVGEFFTSWETYRKVLENNYMYHKEIYQAVGMLLHQQFAHQPFKMLDLGCGDACYLANALQGTTISHYTGFDLSDPALALAADNIATLGCAANLLNIDFKAGLAQVTERFDVIFSSYAVHHLNSEEKANIFALAKQALTENGFLLMIDVMREPTESLPIYLDGYCQWMSDTWTCLNAQEISGFHHHIRHYDMPETVDTLCALAETAGFSKVTTVYQLPWHQALLFCD